MKRLSHYLLGLILVFGLALSACAAPAKAVPSPERPPAASPAPTAPQLSREQKLVEGAKKEGSVVFWAFGGPEDATPVIKVFKEKYPFLEVKEWYAPTGPALMARMTEEAKAGRHTVDLIYVSEKHLLPSPGWKDIIAEYEWPNTENWPLLRGDNYYRIIALSPMTTTYNTALVTTAEAPRAWDDLKSTRWRDKVMMSVSVSDVPLYFAYLWREGGKLNWDKSFAFWREVASNVRPKAGVGMTGPAELHAAGEYALFIMNSMTVGMRFRALGAPMEITPAPSAYSTTLLLALAKNAPHPNAARLLADHFTSRGGQVLLADRTARVIVHPEASKAAKPNLELASKGIRLDEIPAEVNTPQNIQKSIDFWLELLGRYR